MKIGILTYHRAHNYGAMLQAYALRTYLQSLGNEVEFVDYWPDEHAHEYSVWRMPRYYNGVKCYVIDWIAWLMTFTRRAKRINLFNAFAKDFLGLELTARYKSNREVIKENYDVVFFGSDQIWRNHTSELQYLAYDPAYFGSVVPTQTRKVAYAASMGVIKVNEDERRFLHGTLSSFSHLYVRENSLKEFLSNMDLTSELVCDPTLLLSKNAWNAILPKEKYRQKPYLLYYEVMQSYEAKDYAAKLAERMHLDFQVITARVHPVVGRNTNHLASPMEFLQAIRDADFIVATSFHGTAFSIIFEKQFVAMSMGKNSDRVETLLNSIGIFDHYQTSSDLDKAICQIDYSLVNQAKNKYVEHSTRLIKRALDEV